MKVALIPPHRSLPQFGHGNFHLLLSHLLDSTQYYDHYRRQRDNGAYLVLDNAAHEQGEGDDAITLLKQAYRLNAQEIVVPDVLEDGPATVERALQALEVWFESWKEIESLISTHSPALMYVPQGKDALEWGQCLEELIRLHAYISKKHDYRRDFVIGLSKDYEVWPGGLPALIDVLAEERLRLTENLVKMNVHLLGWGRNLWMLGSIARDYPWIRSTDSAKPFVYAMAGINLLRCFQLEVPPPQYPRRPHNYFRRVLNETQTELARTNVYTYLKLAEGVHGAAI